MTMTKTGKQTIWQTLPQLPIPGLTYDEFMSRVRKNTRAGCWLYETNVCMIGYAFGRFDVNGEMITSPGRASYGWAFGNAPRGRKVTHTCGNKLCVNPDHLEIPQNATVNRVRSCAPYSIERIEEKFFGWVDKRGDDECWEWQKSLGNHGYGQMWVGNTVKPTHRISYELHHGPVRKGDYILHTCHNKKCCNPNHLKLGTQSENMTEHAARFKANGGRPAFTKMTVEQRAKGRKTRLVNLEKRKQMARDMAVAHN